MKKYFGLFIMHCLFLGLTSNAQDFAFSSHKKILSIGYSSPQIYVQNFKLWNTYLSSIQGSKVYSENLSPIWFHHEKAISNKISFTYSFGYSHFLYKFTDVATTKFFLYENSNIMGKIRFAYHFHHFNHKHWDPYIGADFGYNYQSIATKALNATNNTPDSISYLKALQAPKNPTYIYTIFAGTRYFYKKIGVFGEVGYSNMSYLQIGLSYKFGPDLVYE